MANINFTDLIALSGLRPSDQLVVVSDDNTTTHKISASNLFSTKAEAFGGGADGLDATFTEAEGFAVSFAGEKGAKGETGTTGAQGPAGDKGDTGATGSAGDKGEKGVPGSAADKGDVGPAGDKGDTGATGPQGPAGDKGEPGTAAAKGDKGEVGATGDKGDTGAAGSNGDKGQKGEVGATGAGGSAGDKGQKGEVGVTGGQGPKGVTGDKGDTADKGQKGEKGIEGGNKGQKGEIGVTGAKGEKGDTGAGGGGSTTSGGLCARIHKEPFITSMNATGSTSTLFPGDSAQITLDNTARSYILMRVETDKQAWVTFYTDQDSLNHDRLRSINVDPSPGAGVIAEVINVGESAHYKQRLTPGVIGFNDDADNSDGSSNISATIYAKVVNQETTAQAITLTAVYLPLENNGEFTII